MDRAGSGEISDQIIARGSTGTYTSQPIREQCLICHIVAGTKVSSQRKWEADESCVRRSRRAALLTLMEEEGDEGQEIEVIPSLALESGLSERYGALKQDAKTWLLSEDSRGKVRSRLDSNDLI